MLSCATKLIMQVILSEFEEATKAKSCQAINSFRQLVARTVPAVCDWWPRLTHDLAQWGAFPALTNTEHYRISLSLHHGFKGAMM